MFGAFGKRLSLFVFGGMLVAVATNARAGEQGFKDLFNGKDLSGWKTIVAVRDANDKKKVTERPDDGKTFQVKDGVIVVSGSPNGYFYTEKSYKNYVLKFDWKYIKDGNSGLLVHIQMPHKVWPKSVEVQGQQKDHGRIFAIGGAKGDFKVDKEAQKNAIRVGEWNTTEVICKEGEITSKINGIQVSTGKGDLTEGSFGLQSEGTELHFKNIKIKTLDAATAQTKQPAKTAATTPAKEPAKGAPAAEKVPVKQFSGTTAPKSLPSTTTPQTQSAAPTTTEVGTSSGGGRLGIFARIRSRFGR